MSVTVKEDDSPNAPMSLSDILTTAATPLHPVDRSAFVAAAMSRLQLEPVVGVGSVARIARELLQSGVYRRQDMLATGDAARAPVHKAAFRGDG
jgi:hypothetical protein